MIKLNKQEIIGISAGAFIILGCFILLKIDFINAKVFTFFLGIAFVIAVMPFFIRLLAESKIEKEKDYMFLEFIRDLVEGVKSGTPISKSIINIKNKDYGVLSLHVQKLANQISVGIPVREALNIFGKETGSSVINRSISLIKEAERSGGKIEAILESVAFSVSQIEKLKKERKAAIYNLSVQGYIIFLIFIVIILVMQFKILPITANLNVGFNSDMKDVSINGAGMTLKNFDINSIANSFLFLLMTQGLFAGLVIGKIAEGSIKAGIKHSIILIVLAFLISTGAQAIFG